MGMKELTHICDAFSNKHQPTGERVIPEPYIPQFPSESSPWNGVLVLATAQNLAGSESVYRKKLIECHNGLDYTNLYKRMNRSYRDFPNEWNSRGRPERHLDTSIGPWKNGLIPFAVAAVAQAFPDSAVTCCEGKDDLEPVRRTMVSNAVVWSRANKDDTLRDPNAKDKSDSARFWKKILPQIEIVMKRTVEEIWVVGRPAMNVCERGGFPERRVFHMQFPDTRNMERFRIELDGDRIEDTGLMELWDALHEKLQIADGKKRLALYFAAVAVKRYRLFLLIRRVSRNLPSES